MKKLFSVGLISAAALILLPTPAHATTWVYNTYGGYDAIVGAWQKVALVFSDGGYQALFYTVIVMGIFWGGTVFYMKALGGARVGGPLSWAFPVGVGIVLYLALVIPKDNLMIYDPVMNEGPVEISGIPMGIAVMAGVLNEIQTGLVDIIDTSGDPVGYQQNAGGIGFNVINQIGKEPPMVPATLQGSINAYVQDCLLFELQRPGTTLTPDQFQNNTDFRPLFEEAQNPAVYTVSYITNSAGETMTCTDAWNAISSAIANPDVAFANSIDNDCAQAGYDPTVPAELNQCQALTSNMSQWIWGSSYSGGYLAMQETLAQDFEQTMASLSPDQAIQTLASKNTGTSWESSGLMANEWVPVIIAGMTAVAIGILPILIIFLPTSLSGKVVSIIAGMFIWLTMWALIDAVIHTGAMDYAAHEAQLIKATNLGTMAVNSFSTFGLKVLALYGNLRWMGLMLSTVITGMLVKFGGSALGRMAAGLTGGAQSGASSAGQTEMDPSAHASTELGYAGVKPTEARAFATRTYSNENSFSAMQMAERNKLEAGLGSGMGYGSPGAAYGAGFAQSERSAGAGEIAKQFNEKFGAQYMASHPGASPEQVQAAAGKFMAATGLNPAGSLELLNTVGAGGFNRIIGAGTTEHMKKIADAEVFKSVADQYGGVAALETDLAGGRLKSTTGAIETYGKLTGAKSFDQAAAGFFATMGTMSGATTAGQRAGLDATGKDGSGAAFKTEREMENEYTKFRMLDAAAKAQNMTPIEFLAAHHGAGITFADSKANGIDTMTMSAGGKTLMSTRTMNLDPAQTEALGKALDRPGTTFAAKPLIAAGKAGQGSVVTENLDGEGNVVSFSAVSGGKTVLEDHSLTETGRKNVQDAVTIINRGLQEKSGTFVQMGTNIERDNVDVDKIDHGTEIGHAFQMALKRDTALVDKVTNPYLSGTAQNAEIAAMVGPLASDLDKFATRSGVSYDYARGDAQLSVGTGGGLLFVKANMGATGEVGGAREDRKNTDLIAQQAETLVRNDLAKAKEKGLSWKETSALVSEDLKGYSTAFQKNVEAANPDRFGASAPGAALGSVLKGAENKMDSAIKVPENSIIEGSERGALESGGG